jgi:thymidylate synthase (FAD)
MQEVKLLESTQNIIPIIYTAARTCYSAESPIDIFNENEYNFELDFDAKENKMLNLIKKVMDSGHHSVLEHLDFTFAIDGISRACSHQLVRHRHASFSQKSQRYVNEGEFDFVTPKRIQENSQALLYFNDAMEKDKNVYKALINLGIPQEDARMVLPNACTTSLVMTLNLRELIHIANLRLCTKAQAEIRELTQEMCDIVAVNEPWLSYYLKPKCYKDGKCTEMKPCRIF